MNTIMKKVIDSAVIGCTPLAMAIIDIDHLKVINDWHGHPAGDQIRIAVAHVLKAHCGEQNAVARIAGEEFAMVLPGAHLAHAIRQCERLRGAMEALPRGEYRHHRFAHPRRRGQP